MYLLMRSWFYTPLTLSTIKAPNPPPPLPPTHLITIHHPPAPPSLSTQEAVEKAAPQEVLSRGIPKLAVETTEATGRRNIRAGNNNYHTHNTTTMSTTTTTIMATTTTTFILC